MRASEEATRRQLGLARAQGDAFERAVMEMLTNEAASGAEQRVADYLVAYAVEEAEGMWAPRGGELVWEEPDGGNCHLEVVVRDAAEGRFVPELEVDATILDADGNEIGTHRQEFLWHPWLYHYGRNWTVPSSGEYGLRIRIERPDFRRHDRRNGFRYAGAVEVEFDRVRIETGQK